MSYTDRDTAHVLAALIVLIVSAHAFGYVFARFRQPPVIGEIVGGIMLGPTLLERVWPTAYDWVFPSTARCRPCWARSTSSGCCCYVRGRNARCAA